MLSELLRNALCSLPPEVEAFGGLTPFGVVLRYEDVIDDQSPVVDAVWCEALVIGAGFFLHSACVSTPASSTSGPRAGIIRWQRLPIWRRSMRVQEQARPTIKADSCADSCMLWTELLQSIGNIKQGLLG
jgi:hypothetical protein